MPDPLDWPALLLHDELRVLTQLALSEDIGSGDVTTAAIFAAPRPARAQIVSRRRTAVCGVPLAAHLVQRLDPAATVRPAVAEGDWLPAGAPLATLEGDLRALLTGERVVLNFLMRLCGIATATRLAVQALGPHSTARLYDTRKTVPGWRRLDKLAVRAGGGHNHRLGLFDAVLIKDNHVAAAGSVAAAVARGRARAGHGMAVEVEVDHLGQLEEAIASGPDVILLDNFSLADVMTAVDRSAGRVPLEVSGGVTEAALPALGRSGVARVSMGALTHSVRPADLSLELCA